MEDMKITELRSLAKRLGMGGYSKLRKDDLVGFIINDLSSRVPRRPPGPTQRRPFPTPRPPVPTPRSQEFKFYQLKPKRVTNAEPQT